MSVVLACTDQDRAAAFAVRHEVFVIEQGVPPDLELDDLDAAADHFILYAGARVVGAARLVLEPPGFAETDAVLGPVGHLGRLAVLNTARGTGAGGALVRAVEARAKERAVRQMVLAAQTHALRFYERYGYHAYGQEFDDAGLPHRWMQRLLTPERDVVALEKPPR